MKHFQESQGANSLAADGAGKAAASERRAPFFGLACAALMMGLWVGSTGEVVAKQQKAGAADISAPVFSPRGGAYSTNVVLQLSAPAAGTADRQPVMIRYRLDGLDPDENSAVYSGPILLTNSTLVRAKVFAKGSPASPIAAEFYTLLDSDVIDFSSNLPLVILDSFGSNVVHDSSVQAGVQFIDPERGRARLADPAHLSSELFESKGLDTFREMQDQKVAQSMADSAPLGIGKAMVAFLSKAQAAQAPAPAGEGTTS